MLLERIAGYTVQEGVAIWWLGGPSVVLKTPRSLVYIDLFTAPLGYSPEPGLTKAIPDVLVPEKIREADLVLSTHAHLDHCHRESLLPIYRNTQATFAGPASSVALFQQWGFGGNRVIQVAAEQAFEKGDLTVTALSANDWDDKAAVTYAIELPEDNLVLFDTGDTRHFCGLADIGRRWCIDLALISFAGSPPPALMGPRDAARAAVDLRTRLVIPKHWDLWAEMRADPNLLAAELEPLGIECILLEQGGMFHLHRSGRHIDLGAWAQP